MKIRTRVCAAALVACGAPALAAGAVAVVRSEPEQPADPALRLAASSRAAASPGVNAPAPRDAADEVRHLDALTADAGRQAHRVAGERAAAAAAAAAAKAAADAVAAKAHAEHQLALDLAAQSGVDWEGIARCETGGNWSMQGSSYSGGVGFYNGTWSSFGGHEFAPNAGMATRDQQIIVAERVHDRHGLSGWGCKRFG